MGAACVAIIGLTSLVAAQAKGANPGFTRKPQASWIIINSFNSVPGFDIQQVFHAKLATDADGQWTTCLTVGRLPTFFGGDGSRT